MAHRNIIIIFAAALMLTVVSGCLDSSRKESAQLRWQQTMDQARLKAAEQSLDQGQLVYARRILRECDQCSDPKSPLAAQMQQILTEIQTEHARYAKAGREVKSLEEIAY